MRQPSPDSMDSADCSTTQMNQCCWGQWAPIWKNSHYTEGGDVTSQAPHPVKCAYATSTTANLAAYPPLSILLLSHSMCPIRQVSVQHNRWSLHLPGMCGWQAVLLGVHLGMKPGGPQSSTTYVPQHSTAWELGVHISVSFHLNK